MTYNFSSCIDPCTSARKSLMIDPRHHHKFNPWYHNFDPSDYNRFNPYDNGLELNIQLPDINIPSCPPAPACPPAPTCPPCPQVKPEPESKKAIDFSKLAITVNPVTDDILDIQTRGSTGYKFKECAKIIQNAKNNLKVVDGKLVGSCEDNSKCDKCVEIINGSIIDSKSAAAFLSTYNIPELEGNIYFL